jgi:hypothetical protein
LRRGLQRAHRGDQQAPGVGEVEGRGFVVPAAHDIYDAGGPTESFAAPVGLSIEPDLRWRIFVEGGYLGGFSQGYNGQPPMVFNNGWNGAYGALAVGYTWRGPS